MNPFSRTNHGEQTVTATTNLRDGKLSPGLSRSRWLITLPLVLLFLIGTLCPALAGDWKGDEVMVDGVRHMKNPAEPMNGTATIDLNELWRIGGDTDDEDEFFGVIIRITDDPDGNVYLLDMQLAEVKVFSPEGEYLRTLGREGEGPGEFRTPTDLFFVPDGNLGVLQAAPVKIVLLTKEGDPAGEYPAPQLEGEGFISIAGAKLAGDHLVVMGQANNFDQEKGTFTQSMMLQSVDPEGKVLATYHTESRLWEFANPVIDEVKWDTIQNRWLVGTDSRVYGCLTHGDYKVHVWNADGTVDRIVECDHEPYKRTKEEIEKVHGIYEAFTRQAPNSELKISEYDKPINTMYLRDDGSLWVLTAHGSRSEEGVLGVFDVFDADGRFVQRVTLNGEGDPLADGYFFVGDRLYVVTDILDAMIAMQGGGGESDEEEEAEPMAVICYQIDDSKLAMK